ncbi:hypothetical protein DFQ27_002537, partial [Actinomortierella ambigua]
RLMKKGISPFLDAFDKNHPQTFGDVVKPHEHDDYTGAESSFTIPDATPNVLPEDPRIFMPVPSNHL